jgi:hypothetical protein
VEALGYDDQGRLFEQLNHYALELPEVLEERPFWTAVLLRDHRNPKVRRMLDIWHAHVQRYSRRDQLSVNLAFRRAGLTPEVLRVDNHESWFHSWPVGTSRRANVIRLASPFLSHPAARAKELARDNAAKSDLLARLERDLVQERLERERSSARVAKMETALADERSRRAALEGSTVELIQAVAQERLERERSSARVAKMETALADERSRRAAGLLRRLQVRARGKDQRGSMAGPCSAVRS